MTTNIHWRSIYFRIDEMWWPYVNYVGYMEKWSKDTKTFFASVHFNKGGISAWDRNGKTGWGDNERNCAGGNSSFLGERDNYHQANAKEKMLHYYTPDLEKFVESHCADDLNNRYFQFEKMKIGLFDKTDANDTIIDFGRL